MVKKVLPSLEVLKNLEVVPTIEVPLVFFDHYKLQDLSMYLRSCFYMRQLFKGGNYSREEIINC